MEYLVDDMVVYLGCSLEEGTTIIYEYQKIIISPSCLTIGKTYKIKQITGYTLWIDCDDGRELGYKPLEHGGFYKFGKLREVRKAKLNKINGKIQMLEV